MTSSSDLRHQFLISMPHLSDPCFAQTLTFICDHSEYGAMGLIINRTCGMELGDLLNHLELPARGDRFAQQPVFDGGPVHEDRGFVLHTEAHGQSELLASHRINEDLLLTTSLDILEAIANGQAPEHFLVALGYAGWGPGQLEQELSDNLWLSCPYNFDILFRMPAEERLHAAASILGINLNLLTAHAGHA
ncbi:MAG: YqgE/AlgH family protein [Oceanospirillaceae bacterium]|uniref:YqgE/AlgH family protein n=1 Tax=Marinobacterium litorale TaxID=404770 RepID=UPI00041952E4|nr:YqgE/AlgH family protein [Marinobacterium litorale]MBS97997.1 YqgE/AlgH family protein [Oceanospirillaceae bacterium]